MSGESLFLGSECRSNINSETFSESGEDMEVVHSRFEPYDGEPLANSNENEKTLQILTALHQKYLQKDSLDKLL